MTRKDNKCKRSMDLVDSLKYSFISLKNDNNPPNNFSVDISKSNTIFMGMLKKHRSEKIFEKAFFKQLNQNIQQKNLKPTSSPYVTDTYMSHMTQQIHHQHQ